MSTLVSYELRKYTFILNGLTCANCAAKIESALHEDSNYEEVNFSFATKKLQLTSPLEKDELQDSLQKIVDGIEEGVTVSSSENAGEGTSYCMNESCSIDRDQGHENSHSDCHTTASNLKSNIIINVLRENYQMLLGAILVVAIILLKPSMTIAISLYIVAYILIGRDVVTRAIKNLLKGNLFDEYFLMTIATLGAFALGEYTEAVMVMLFYKVGEGFQEYAVDYSRRSIQSLLNIKADYANLIVDGVTKKVAPEFLNLNDIIMIKAGEKVPVDGIILEGYSFLDTSALTGESFPRKVEVGDEVLSGAINTVGVLKVQVTKTYENSTVARILEMVENATGKKAKTEQFITKFAKVYTPIVVFMALFLAILPPVLGMGDFREWLARALIFLVISCPCALVISVPLGYFAGLGVASRRGILIKGGNYLEALNTIDTFVFDKTGTLTKGYFRVQRVTGDNTLALAAALESHSTHPIARSILTAYGEEVVQDGVVDVTEFSGEGLSGIYEGKALIVGNSRLMNRFDITAKSDDFAGSVVHVAYDRKYIGAVHIADQIKPDSYALANSLKTKGAISLVMLTGDQEKIAVQVANELGFDSYHSQLLPQDKMSYVEEYIADGAKVLFAGDGINDAPVLARADIGVAMGGLGSDAAIEAADIVLMTDEPTKLIEAMNIAEKTRRIVLQNIIFALGIKAFFLGLGAFGIATMYEAIFADVGVTLIAVLNSMRILRV